MRPSPAPPGPRTRVDARRPRDPARRACAIAGDSFVIAAEQAQVIKVARRVYVGNLSWSTTWHSLKDHFKTVSARLRIHCWGRPFHRSGALRRGARRDFPPATPGRALRGSAGPRASCDVGLFRAELPRQAHGFRRGAPARPLPRRGARAPRRARPAGGTPRLLRWKTFGGRHVERAPRTRPSAPPSQVGTVRYADVLLEAGGRSKGCGIVEFEDANEAAAAIRELNDSELDGRQIYVVRGGHDVCRASPPSAAPIAISARSRWLSAPHGGA